MVTTTRNQQIYKATGRVGGSCIDQRFDRQQDVNLVKIRLLEKRSAQHLAAFWIVIAAKTNAIKKRVNPFTRQAFDHSVVINVLQLISIKKDRITTISSYPNDASCSEIEEQITEK